MDRDGGGRDERVIVLIGSPAQVAATLQELHLDVTSVLTVAPRESREAPSGQSAEPSVESDERQAPREERASAPEAARAANADNGNDFDRAVALLRERHRLLHTQCLVLALRFRGFENEEAAHALGVEIATVKFHIGNVLRRIGVEPRTRVPRIFAETVAELEHASRALPCEDDAEWLQPLQTALRRLRRRPVTPEAIERGLASGRAHPTAGSKSRGTP